MITCLAIDDDPLFLKLLTSYCQEMEGIELIATYTNPVEGVMAVVKLKPDILLLDLEMPYLDGFEMISTLDQKPKIVVISGHLTEKPGNTLDIDRYISKSSIREVKELEKTLLEVYHS